MSLERFSRRIRIRADNVPREVNRIVRQVALIADQTLVLATPVDTGRARSNWLVSLEAPRESEIEPYNPLPEGTDPAKFGESGNARSAINQARDQIGRRKPGQTIYITNNVPYIQRLNDGFSAQAPAMFVEIAIQQAVAAVRNARLDTGRGGVA